MQSTSSNGFARNGLIVSRISPPLRSPRGGAARRAISRSTRPAWSAKQKDNLPLVRPFGKECLSPLSLVRCHAPNIRFPFTADFFGKRFVLRTSTCAHVVSPRDITCSIIPRDGRGRTRLVRTRFHLRPLICPTAIFNSPYPHPVEIGAVDAVAGSDDPPLGDEGAAATDPLAQEALFDDGHL